MQEILTDILVIGSGGAGLRAVLAANDTNPSLKVTMMTAGYVGEDSVTATACSDRMAFQVAFDHTPPGGDEAWKAHAKDIYIGGGYVSDPNLAVTLAYKARDAFAYLEKLGVPWVRNVDGIPDQFLTDGSAYPRACYTGPYTARDIHRALFNEAQRRNIDILENTRLINWVMLSEEQPCFYVTVFDNIDGCLKNIIANAIILATGGPGALFGSPLYPEEADCMPYYLAMLSGAKLVNLEFIQMGLVSPLTKLACSGSMLRALPKVVDDSGREILTDIDLPEQYDSHLDLLFIKGASWPVSAESPALPVDIEIWRATSAGRKIYFDFRENPTELNESIYWEIISNYWKSGNALPYAPTPYDRLLIANPQVIDWFDERDVDLLSGPTEIRHEAQHFQGGILINERAETGVPGLYACGECAGGQHGANRPGGNSLLDAQVMGAIAGSEAAKYAAGKPLSRWDNIKPRMGGPFDYSEDLKITGWEPDYLNWEIVDILTREMGVLRTADGLLQAFHEIHEIRKEGLEGEGDSRLNHLSKMAVSTIAMAFIQAAWTRKESRGAHIYFKSQYDPCPSPPNNHGGRIWNAARLDNHGELRFGKLPIPSPRIRNG